jgi:hypothetical protein
MPISVILMGRMKQPERKDLCAEEDLGKIEMGRCDQFMKALCMKQKNGDVL